MKRALESSSANDTDSTNGPAITLLSMFQDLPEIMCGVVFGEFGPLFPFHQLARLSTEWRDWIEELGRQVWEEPTLFSYVLKAYVPTAYKLTAERQQGNNITKWKGASYNSAKHTLVIGVLWWKNDARNPGTKKRLVILSTECNAGFYEAWSYPANDHATLILPPKIHSRSGDIPVSCSIRSALITLPWLDRGWAEYKRRFRQNSSIPGCILALPFQIIDSDLPIATASK